MLLLVIKVIFFIFQLGCVKSYFSFRQSFARYASSVESSTVVSATLKKRQFHITTVDGLEDVLVREIQSKIPDIENLTVQKKGVTFTGTSKSGFEALLWLRTSLKVMEKIDVSHIGAENDQIFVYNKDDLYDFISLIDWNSMIRYDQTIKCDATISSTTSPTLTHTHFTALTIKNAIIDQFRNHYKDDSCRPDVDLENPMLPLLLYLHRNEAFLYRVWSGDQSMHKRGYRSDSVIHKASLRETTAAGIVLKAQWDARNTLLCDPMCGSGTIPIEAALIAADTAPGLLRYSLAEVVENRRPVPLFWKDIQAEEGIQLWKTTWQHAVECDKRKQMRGKIIFGNDLIRGSLELARASAAKAGVSNLIDFTNKDIIDYYLPSSDSIKEENERKFTVITNPPWDKRLEANEDDSWGNLNEFLLDSSPRLDIAFILNGNPSLTRLIEAKPQKKYYINAAKTPMDLLVYRFPVLIKQPSIR